MNTTSSSIIDTMKQARIIFILWVFAQTLFAQKTEVDEFAAIDKIALKLPDSKTRTTANISDYIKANFKTDKGKSRAIFIWIATNIRYDIENMYAINFYEKNEEKISKPLKSRKGICENYAALFNDICIKSGIRSFVIEGYTKQNGSTGYLPHAWCAALIDRSWYLFDPTWGSGYVDEGKFYRKINNSFFMAKPSDFIKSHIPFDYLWQFLNYPITNQEFYEGKTIQNKSRRYFNYIDSIRVYENQNNIDQLISSACRIEKNGVKNSMIFDRLQHIKLEVENYRQNIVVNLYNSAAADYNNGINKLNEFIDYRNKQFTPNKTDSEIQDMLDAADYKLNEAKLILAQIRNPDADTRNMILQLIKSIDDAAEHLTEQQEWLILYFSKGKPGRKSMFYEKKLF